MTNNNDYQKYLNEKKTGYTKASYPKPVKKTRLYWYSAQGLTPQEMREMYLIDTNKG